MPYSPVRPPECSRCRTTICPRLWHRGRYSGGNSKATVGRASSVRTGSGYKRTILPFGRRWRSLSQIGDWLTAYLQPRLDLGEVLRSFPDDEPMRAAVAACRGLRLLRQDPWECLASFILSSTKQIVQIRQIISLLCERYGEPVAVPPDHATAHAFPSPDRLARVTESELRTCKMGFRAPHLLAAARSIGSGRFDLARLHKLPLAAARDELMQLPGVGPKIADCVLLFAYGFPSAFPVDVWVMRALQRLYFPKRRANLQRLRQFAATHFGPHAGYAQQYLFHYIRTKAESGNSNDNP